MRLVNNTEGSITVKLGSGSSYVNSPDLSPVYPVPEIPAIILVTAGLAILVW